MKKSELIERLHEFPDDFEICLFGHEAYYGPKERIWITFSARETRIIRLICDEVPTKVIAHEFKITQRSVDYIRRSLIRKVGAVCTAGLVKYAILNGIYKQNQPNQL